MGLAVPPRRCWVKGAVLQLEVRGLIPDGGSGQGRNGGLEGHFVAIVGAC